MVPGGARYRESIALGPTALSGQEVEDLVKRLSREYLGDRYHLLYRNCNHFTSELAERLTGSASPGWVNRLAALARLLNTVTPCILPPRCVWGGREGAGLTASARSIRTLARPPALKGDAQPLLPPGVPRISDSEARRPLHPTAALGGAAHVPRAPPGS